MENTKYVSKDAKLNYTPYVDRPFVGVGVNYSSCWYSSSCCIGSYWCVLVVQEIGA